MLSARRARAVNRVTSLEHTEEEFRSTCRLRDSRDAFDVHG